MVGFRVMAILGEGIKAAWWDVKIAFWRWRGRRLREALDKLPRVGPQDPTDPDSETPWMH